jgi:hypothetical protein
LLGTGCAEHIEDEGVALPVVKRGVVTHLGFWG